MKEERIQWLTSQQEEKKHNDEGVTEIQEGTGCSMNLQLGHKIVNTVSKEVHRGETTGQERTPPPVVVLSKVQSSIHYF